MSNYDNWCKEKNMPPALAALYLNWLSKRETIKGDVTNLANGLYNNFMPIYTDEVLARVDKLLKEMETK